MGIVLVPFLFFYKYDEPFIGVGVVRSGLVGGGKDWCQDTELFKVMMMIA